MEKRNINIKVTSNAKKVMSGLGDETSKQGKKSIGVLGKIKALSAGITNGFTAASGGVRAFSTALISSGVGAFVVAMGSLVALLSKSINTSKDFEKALSGLKAITGASSEEMKALAQNAKALGKSTAFTASQVVQLQTEFSKLGFSTGEILNATEATLNLAAASGTDLADAAVVAGNTIRAFGLDASESGRIADVMAKSFTSSALDMEKFRESMKLVAPIAKVTNSSLEESSAALAILADRGVSGSMAGTQLKRILSDLSKDGKPLQESLKDTADKLAAAGSVAEKLAIATELVGDRAKGSLIALAENREELKGLETAFLGANGAAKKTAEEGLNNLAGDLTKLKSAIEGFFLSIEDGEGVLNSFVRNVVQVLTFKIAEAGNNLGRLADSFRVIFASIGRVSSGMASRLGEVFNNIGLTITGFAQKAKMSISDIPFIGKAIDKNALEANMKATEKALLESNARLQELADKSSNESVLRAEHYAKLRAARVVKIEEETKKKIDKINTEDINTGGAVVSEEEQARLDKAAAKRAKQIEDEKKFIKKLYEAGRDQDAQNRLEKNELDRTRFLEELEQTVADETKKRQAIEDVNKLFDSRANLIREEDRKASKELKDASDADILEQEELMKQKRMMQMQSVLDATARAFGETTKMGKLALITKQALLVKEMAMEAKKTLSSVSLKAAEAAADTSTGFAKTLSAGFPQNIPLLAGYALQAAAIGKTIAGAVGRAKEEARGSGGSVNTPNLSLPKAAPAFNVVGTTDNNTKVLQQTIRESMGDKTIKAYVVSKDVTEQQDLDSLIGNNASLG